jgi:hypothetical protein
MTVILMRKGIDSMFDIAKLFGEYDPDNRIVHITASQPIQVRNVEHGLILSQAIKEILKQHLGDGRGYMVTDYTRIILDFSNALLYAREIKDMIDTYLYPGGIARYGMEISRITARMGHKEYLGGDPNLFDTREEAFAYIYALIERNRAEAAAPETIAQRLP